MNTTLRVAAPQGSRQLQVATLKAVPVLLALLSKAVLNHTSGVLFLVGGNPA